MAGIIEVKDQGKLRIYDADNSHYIDIVVPGTVTANRTITIPDASFTVPQVTNATHSGEVTGATALTIADNIVDEANLKISNTPTNGYALTAQSGDTGGLTWAATGLTGVSTASGNVTITDGNLVLASGHGIDFAATGNISGTSSELLDDYEEGTFTPAWSFGSGSVSYSAQTGIYTRVGRMVNFVAYLHTSGTSSPSGAAQITGLPFTVTGEFGGNVGILYRWDLANLLAVLQPRVSGTVIQFFIGNSNAEASQLQGSAFRDGNVKNVILISGSYAAA